MAAQPSSNGGNGRDSSGRFTKGNPGGPGNPYASVTARLRQAARDAVPPERIERIFDKLAAKAESGDIGAAKLVLSYVIGRPECEADRLGREEGEAFNASFGLDSFGMRIQSMD